VNKINHLTKWLVFVLAISISLIVWLFLVNSTDDKILLWARYTARISFCFFTASFVASSIHYFLSNTLTSFIVNNRRHIGLSFALAHTIHLVALISFFVTTNQTPEIVTVLGGGLAYVAMYIMAFTSNDNAVRKIGFKRWKLIHKVGANYIGFIFAFTYLASLTKEEYSSVEFNLLFSIIIAAFALRVLHFFRTRNKDKELQRTYKT
jgi:sulfoxide reductase heme-binding subunit YedZ